MATLSTLSLPFLLSCLEEVPSSCRPAQPREPPLSRTGLYPISTKKVPLFTALSIYRCLFVLEVWKNRDWPACHNCVPACQNAANVHMCVCLLECIESVSWNVSVLLTVLWIHESITHQNPIFFRVVPHCTVWRCLPYGHVSPWLPRGFNASLLTSEQSGYRKEMWVHLLSSMTLTVSKTWRGHLEQGPCHWLGSWGQSDMSCWVPPCQAWSSHLLVGVWIPGVLAALTFSGET